MLIALPPLQDIQNNVQIISTKAIITTNICNPESCEQILKLQREVNELKQELTTTRKSRNTWKQKYLVAKGEKKIIRQVDLTRMMRVDSNLNRLTIETILNAKKYYIGLRVKPENIKVCPITNEVINLVSLYIRNNYDTKETELKRTYHFKEEPFY